MFAFSGRSSASAAAAAASAGHKKPRKKKSIPVAPPKLPSFESSLFPHVSSSNGQASPSSSYPKLLNVLPDASGKLRIMTSSRLSSSAHSLYALSALSFLLPACSVNLYVLSASMSKVDLVSTDEEGEMWSGGGCGGGLPGRRMSAKAALHGYQSACQSLTSKILTDRSLSLECSNERSQFPLSPSCESCVSHRLLL